MLLGETVRISLSSIRSNLFRALLTMLGIIIGVGAVITMVALGTGAQRQIDEQMAAFGGDILSIQSSAWFSRGVARNQRTLTTDDALALAMGPKKPAGRPRWAQHNAARAEERARRREAKEAIWDDPAKFEQAANAARDATAAFATAAAGGDKAKIAEAHKKVGKSCKGCHEDFRQKDD